MPSVVLCFEVHQPRRIRAFGQCNGDTEPYFDDGLNHYVFERAARKCYWPTNNIILSLIDQFGKDFKASYAITGTWLEQCEKYDPSLLDTFKMMARTGCIEFLDETYYHSLSSLFDEEKNEFREQVEKHNQAMKDLIGYSPKVFKNTEAIYNNSIAKAVSEMGYKGIVTEGFERFLGWRSPNYLYRPPRYVCDIKILLRNYRLSDDVGYRFSASWWDKWPLTADRYAAWLSAAEGGHVVFFVDYETFGEHQWPETGILEFLRHLPNEVLKYGNLNFATPSEIMEREQPMGEFDVFEYNTLSWADIERDTSAWLGNEMQQTCFNEIKSLEPIVKKLNDPEILHVWRQLQTSDHLYYMCTKWWNDGDVHKYFSSFDTPAKIFSSMMRTINDLKTKINEKLDHEPGLERCNKL